MKEKGGHFVRAYALAIAAHALLFLLLAGLIRNAAPVPGGGIPVEIQFAGPGTGGGTGAGPGAARTPKPPARPRATVRAAPAPMPSPSHAPSSAPAPSAPAPSPAPTPPPAASPASSPAATTPDLPDAAAWGDNSGGAGGDVGGGSAGSGGGNGGGTSGGPGVYSGGPATISDIEPTPIQPISAAYPATARRLGQQGLVRIRADIDNQGLVADCAILTSSGFASLDNAALQAVRSTRFWPARKNGRSIPSSIIVPVRFKLTQN